MSNDEAVTKDLMETLQDGVEGFAKGAEKLEASDASIATRFRELSEQRAAFYAELQQLAAEYGDRVEESGSVAATFHRGWMALKDAISGSSAKGVLDAAKQGEDHAVKEYDKALGEELSPTLRDVVARQATEVKAARDTVAALEVAAG